ncbi:hypothetical protein KAJ27_18765 [bacterium]|nr:hypothetical protein [bacterium]
MNKFNRYLLLLSVILLPVFVYSEETVKVSGINVSKSINNDDIFRFDQSIEIYRTYYNINDKNFTAGFTYGIKFVHVALPLPFPYLEFRPGYTLGRFSFKPKIGAQVMMAVAGPGAVGMGIVPYLSLDLVSSFKLPDSMYYLDLAISRYDDIIKYEKPSIRLQIGLSYRKNSN